MNNLPPIYAPLDPAIAPLVQAMRAAGFPTQDSCDGKGSQLIGVPWINIATGTEFDHATLTPRLTRAAVVHFLKQRNIYANVCEVYGTVDATRGPVGEEVPAYPYVRIEIFTPLDEIKL